MPDTAPEKLFQDLPSQVTFPLNQKSRLPHSLCWFAGKDGKLPEVNALWRANFEATEEELVFSNDSRNVTKLLSQHELFGIPYKSILHGAVEDDEPSLGIGLGKAASGSNSARQGNKPRYACCFSGKALWLTDSDCLPKAALKNAFPASQGGRFFMSGSGVGLQIA